MWLRTSANRAVAGATPMSDDTDRQEQMQTYRKRLAALELQMWREIVETQMETDRITDSASPFEPPPQPADSAPAHLTANVERFMGFADVYDTYRPQPPPIILDILTQLAQAPRPALVADLGSGTGLSTAIWAARAESVVGVEPSADMRRQAVARTAAESRRREGLPDATNVRYQEGYSSATGLPDGCADIVTCSQSLHWMEPESTFAEVARVLRPGGVFAAYDCDWPPTFNWEAEHAYSACLAQATAKEQAYGVSRDVHHWDKRQHLERIRASGRFRFAKEIVLHHVEQGSAERLVGLALSQGGIATLQKHGLSEDEIGITALREAARRVLGKAVVPWYFSYRLRVGVK
jgi:SAM-dependent methyltransferase